MSNAYSGGAGPQMPFLSLMPHLHPFAMQWHLQRHLHESVARAYAASATQAMFNQGLPQNHPQKYPQEPFYPAPASENELRARGAEATSEDSAARIQPSADGDRRSQPTDQDAGAVGKGSTKCDDTSAAGGDDDDIAAIMVGLKSTSQKKDVSGDHSANPLKRSWSQSARSDTRDERIEQMSHKAQRMMGYEQLGPMPLLVPGCAPYYPHPEQWMMRMHQQHAAQVASASSKPLTFVDSKPKEANNKPVKVPTGARKPKPPTIKKQVRKPRTQIVQHTDGYNWLKYGQKIVKPRSAGGRQKQAFHRNYYRCCSEGCPAKKTVEHDIDPEIVDGRVKDVRCTTVEEHNHLPGERRSIGNDPNPGAIIFPVVNPKKMEALDDEDKADNEGEPHEGALVDRGGLRIEEDSDIVSQESEEDQTIEGEGAAEQQETAEGAADQQETAEGAPQDAVEDQSS